MNRRGFLGALAALIGAVVAKVKGRPKLKPLPEPVTWHGQFGPDYYVFTRSHIYVRSKDGTYKWEPTATQKHLLGFKAIDTE